MTLRIDKLFHFCVSKYTNSICILMTLIACVQLLLAFNAYIDASTASTGNLTNLTKQLTQSKSDDIRIVSLSSLKNIFDAGQNNYHYLFIVSSQFEMWFTKLSPAKQQEIKAGINPLKQVLEAKPELAQVIGKSNESELICSIEQKDETVVMKREYSTFKNGESTMIIGNLTCYACDLLANYFMVRLDTWLNFYKVHNETINKIGTSSHMWFALLNKGTAAYCPTMTSLIQAEHFADPTCNNLGSQWDACFPRLALATGIKRIVTPDYQEAWLTCMWSASSFNKNATFACYNLIHQILVDVIQAFEELDIDYRLVYGTLLGAIRNHDIIPWTVDVDLVVLAKEDDKFYSEVLSKFPAHVKWAYSTVDCEGDTHSPPLRVIPSCPVLIKSSVHRLDEIDNKKYVDVIKTEFSARGTQAGSNWRQMGYVDVYYPGDIICGNNDIWNTPENVTIREHIYKGLSNESFNCLYGANWNKNPPRIHQSFDNYHE